MIKLIKHILLLLLITHQVNAGYNSKSAEERYVQYIKEILSYTSWSSQTMLDKIKLCIVGDFNDYSVFRGIQGTMLFFSKKPLEILYIKTNINIVTKCNAVFIPEEQQILGKKIIKILKNKPVLTIGENGFAWHGGMISLYSRSKRLKFDINYSAIINSNVLVDTKILELGNIIDQ